MGLRKSNLLFVVTALFALHRLLLAFYFTCFLLQVVKWYKSHGLNVSNSEILLRRSCSTLSLLSPMADPILFSLYIQPRSLQ